MPDDLRERIGVIAEKSGFVPNVFRALARRPAELRAFLDYHDALMERVRRAEQGRARARRRRHLRGEPLHLLRGRPRRDPAGARRRTRRSPTGSRRTRGRSSSARGSARSSTSRCCVATDSAALTDAELDDARAAGLSDDEIWDVGAITALFAMSNRLAHLTALRPNPEFFLMGRRPDR